MAEWWTDESARAFALSCTVVCLEMLTLALVTPILRTKRNRWLNEEDAKRFSGTVADVEHPDVARVIRVHRNQPENFVPFFALGLLWLLFGGHGRLGVALFAVFALARTAHIFFYLTRRGQLRTASHTLSLIVLVPRHRGFDRSRSELGYFVGGDAEGDASGLAGESTNQTAALELDDHPVDGWRGDAEELLDVGLGGGATVEQDVGVDEGEVLALLVGEAGLEAIDMGAVA